MQTLLDNHWNGSGQAQMTDELENDIDYPDSIPPRKSRLAALLMAAFVITLILALLASMLIGQPQGDPIRPPTITPTINPTYKNGSLLLPRRNQQRLFLPGMLDKQKPSINNVLIWKPATRLAHTYSSGSICRFLCCKHALLSPAYRSSGGQFPGERDCRCW